MKVKSRIVLSKLWSVALRPKCLGTKSLRRRSWVLFSFLVALLMAVQMGANAAGSNHPARSFWERLLPRIPRFSFKDSERMAEEFTFSIPSSGPTADTAPGAGRARSAPNGGSPISKWDQALPEAWVGELPRQLQRAQSQHGFSNPRQNFTLAIYSNPETSKTYLLKKPRYGLRTLWGHLEDSHSRIRIWVRNRDRGEGELPVLLPLGIILDQKNQPVAQVQELAETWDPLMIRSVDQSGQESWIPVSPAAAILSASGKDLRDSTEIRNLVEAAEFALLHSLRAITFIQNKPNFPASTTATPAEPDLSRVLIHGDFKFENVVYSESLNGLRLIDWDSVHLESEIANAPQSFVTPEFAPPESLALTPAAYRSRPELKKILGTRNWTIDHYSLGTSLLDRFLSREILTQIYEPMSRGMHTQESDLTQHKSLLFRRFYETADTSALGLFSRFREKIIAAHDPGDPEVTSLLERWDRIAEYTLSAIHPEVARRTELLEEIGVRRGDDSGFRSGPAELARRPHTQAETQAEAQGVTSRRNEPPSISTRWSRLLERLTRPPTPPTCFEFRLTGWP